MVLWCHTVTSSVQGSTMRTMARMSRLFGISKAGWAHSSSLPERQQGQERGGPGDGGSRQREHGGEKTGMGRAGQAPGAQRSRMLASRSYQGSQPTHCGSRFAESSPNGVWEGVAVWGTVRSPTRWTPKRQSRRGWPETWVGHRCPEGRPSSRMHYGAQGPPPHGLHPPTCLVKGPGAWHLGDRPLPIHGSQRGIEVKGIAFSLTPTLPPASPMPLAKFFGLSVSSMEWGIVSTYFTDPEIKQVN